MDSCAEGVCKGFTAGRSKCSQIEAFRVAIRKKFLCGIARLFWMLSARVAYVAPFREILRSWLAPTMKLFESLRWQQVSEINNRVMRRHPTHGIRGAKPPLRKVITESDGEVEQLNRQYCSARTRKCKRRLSSLSKRRYCALGN